MNFDFYPQLIIRTPAFSIENILNQQLTEHLNSDQFLEALFLASPNLAEKFVSDTQGQIEDSLLNTIIKYYNRMSFRCTPFGLFAGCSVVEWGEATHINITSNVIRRTRLDRELLSKLIDRMREEEQIFNHLILYVNNTIYRLGDEIRYIETVPSIDEQNEYTIATIQDSKLLDFLLKTIDSNRSSVKDLVLCGKKAGYSGTLIRKSLKFLLSNQIVTTNLNLAIPSDLLLEECRTFLTKIKLTPVVEHWLKYIDEIKKHLFRIDKDSTHNNLKYQALFKHLLNANFNQPVNKLLQTDYILEGRAGRVSYKIQRNLKTAINIISMISVADHQNYNLTQFKNRFLKKFELQEIPLLIALDPEVGIDYLEGTSSFDLYLSREFKIRNSQHFADNSKPNFNLTYLIRKYDLAMINNEMVIELTEQDLNQMEKVDCKLPLTLGVFFRLIDDEQVQIDSVGGSSGTNLIARFSDFSPEIKNIVKDVSEYDEHHSEGKIVAEVIHEPEPRSANVIAHQSFRKFEISYLSRSGARDVQSIPLSDIVLSIKNNRLILRSIKYDREIQPKISHAYNYLLGSPIYRFLGDFQNIETVGGMKFDYQKILPGKIFYPRLSYKNITFFPATWIIKVDDITEGVGSLNISGLKRYLGIIKLAGLFIISQGDNELLVDQNNTVLMEMFLIFLKKQRIVTVKEFLINEQNYSIRNTKGQPLNNQLYAIVLNKAIDKNKLTNRNKYNVKFNFTRKFSLGSEWIYFKFYCGAYSGDKILINNILPLITSLKRQRLIKKAFFIRYNDPETHLRVRFEIMNVNDVQIIISEVSSAINKLEQTSHIWKISTETYEREMERYGIAIKESEALFSADSISVLKLLVVPAVGEDPNGRLMAGIRLVSDLQTAFGLNINERIVLCKEMRASLKKDLKLDAQFEQELSACFKNKNQLYHVFKTNKNLNTIFESRAQIMHRLSLKIANLHAKSKTEQSFYKSLLISYIHMCVNRLFMSNQKIYELIIYDFLYKSYNAESGKS
ncbi:lantibiotic dehydratase [Mucilaginibacter sp. HC2]|uniref:lantibiotic dehydratase n=1 Tax=Mucilaginibacter inviolabilis TaxID=2714892 RepID=UPI0014076AC4|nr:lantibiotic dehydratase [Mucilaginibacter inviolabilis]NHA05825.1 lantibiotic dehydratase [Mucilaginibacter inviolabilis]